MSLFDDNLTNSVCTTYPMWCIVAGRSLGARSPLGRSDHDPRVRATSLFEYIFLSVVASDSRTHASIRDQLFWLMDIVSPRFLMPGYCYPCLNCLWSSLVGFGCFIFVDPQMRVRQPVNTRVTGDDLWGMMVYRLRRAGSLNRTAQLTFHQRLSEKWIKGDRGISENHLEEKSRRQEFHWLYSSTA